MRSEIERRSNSREFQKHWDHLKQCSWHWRKTKTIYRQFCTCTSQLPPCTDPWLGKRSSTMSLWDNDLYRNVIMICHQNHRVKPIFLQKQPCLGLIDSPDSLTECDSIFTLRSSVWHTQIVFFRSFRRFHSFPYLSYSTSGQLYVCSIYVFDVSWPLLWLCILRQRAWKLPQQLDLRKLSRTLVEPHCTKLSPG